MTKPINALLHNLFEKKDSWKLQLLQQWNEIMGNLSSFVQLEKMEHDTLILGVSDSCWLQELYLMSPLLLKTINEKLANAPIKQLRFRLSGTKPTFQRNYKAPQLFTKKLVELCSAEKQALARIDDPELRLALEQFLIRCYREK